MTLTQQIARQYGCKEEQIKMNKRSHNVIYFTITITRSQDWYAFLTDTGKLKKNSMRLDDRGL